jgi:ABC-2 type transport system permease protein
VRWLAAKDLRILRRSPMLLVVLVAYSLLLGVAVGLSRGTGPTKPRVAVVNEIPEDRSTFQLGGETIDVNETADDLFESIDPIRVETREEAIEKVRNGDALGALIVPADIPDKLNGTINLTGGDPPTVEVYYSGDNPLKSRFVQSAIKSRIADANRALSKTVVDVAAQYLGYILRGGEFSVLGESFDVLGLERAEEIVAAVQASLPADSPKRKELETVRNFAELAADNLDLSNELLATIGEPIKFDEHIIGAAEGADDAYTFAIALSIPLMFVCVLLGAGLLALEREEHVFGRLVRGLVSRGAVVVEKTGVSAALGFLASLLTLSVLVIIGNDISTGHIAVGLGLVAIGGIAFGALGVLLGGVARDVRTASLLGVLLLLPIAFIGLIPAGLTSSGIYDAIRAVSALFPFRPVVNGLNEALRGEDILARVGHLVLLAAAYGTFARLALRRFS